MASTLTVDKIKGGSSGVALTLPTTDGSAGQLLKTDGSAVLSWATDVDTGITSVAADTTPQLGGDLDCNGAQIQWSKGADVVSATALPVLTDGNYFDVTGTTAVTSINTTGGAGTLIKLHFDAILTLTHHATDLILPGGANITTAAGDEAEFIEYAAGDYRCTNYSKADGTSVVGGLDDNSVTLAKMAGGTDGNLITYDASGDPAYVTTGTSGQVLTSGGVGVAPTFQTAASGGGKVINVYSSYYTSNYYNSSIGSGTTSIPLSVTLTPDTVNSRFIIQWVVPHTSNVGYNYAELLLKRGGTTVGNPLQFFSHNEHAIAHPNLAVDSPSTTSSITYQLSATDSANNSNLWVNKGTQQNGSGSTMVVWELDS